MSKHRIRNALLLSALAAASQTGNAQTTFGRPVTGAEISQQSLTIFPDGTGLPPGSGSVAEGAAIFAAKCQDCHGVNGVGGSQARLTGGIGTLATDAPIKTIASYWQYSTTVFDFIRRAMPFPQPQSLTNDEVYALVAFLLSVDGIVEPDTILNAATLPKVPLPNRNGFISIYPVAPKSAGLLPQPPAIWPPKPSNWGQHPRPGGSPYQPGNFWSGFWTWN